MGKASSMRWAAAGGATVYAACPAGAACGRRAKSAWAPLRNIDVLHVGLARIGRCRATESMPVRDEAAQHCDAATTPSFGTHTLFEHHARLLRGEAQTERREHAVF